MIANNYINHVVLVLDASSSMQRLERDVVQVADNTIAYLAQRSQELNQETRVTIYKFDDRVECLVYDKDVLRLPSIASLYRTHGMTALIDATMKSIQDLEKTATLYGDHAFLIYVLTDGMENRSILSTRDLSHVLSKLPDNWTLACMVPDQQGVFEAKRFGFAPNNIAVWNTDAQGIKEVGEVIRQTSETFMVNRAQGIRGSKNLFHMDVAKIDTTKLMPIQASQHTKFNVSQTVPIAEFIRRMLGYYDIGSTYYELVKTEEVQAKKNILVVRKSTGEVYSSKDARAMLGLPSEAVKVAPASHPEYTIYVQSTSVNRKLPAGTSVIVMH